VFPGSAYQVAMTDIPQPAAGAQPTDITRNGDKVTVTSIHVRYKWAIEPDTSNAPVAGYAVRIVVFQYKPMNGLLAPVQTRLFVNDTTTQPGCLSHQNVDHHNDYHILYDRMYSMAGNVSADTGTMPSNGVRTGSFWVPLKKATKNLQFDSASTSHNNAIYIAVFCDSTGAGDPTFQFQSRARFLDG